MTAVAADLLGVDREPSPVVVLALQEGWRTARHPATLLGLAWGLVATGLIADNGPRDAFETVTSAVTFFLGVPVFFAANLVASRDRRAGSTELLAPSPVPPHARTHALLLAALVPATLALAVVLAGHAVNTALGHYEVAPSGVHLLVGPVTVLGAALLGVMVARWAPVPGAAALVMVALVAWDVVTTNRPSTVNLLGTYVSWPRWTSNSAWIGLEPGSPTWHAGYLLGLCAMAATGALLRTAPRRAPLLGVGALAVAVTALCGWQQLP